MDRILLIIIGSLNAALIIVLLKSWFDRRAEQHKLTLVHLQRQIRELYGPLHCLLNRTKQLHDIYTIIVTIDRNGMINPTILIGSDGRQHPEKLPQPKLEIWHYFSDKYFIPSNNRMRLLIESNYDLLDSNELSQSFKDFLDHEAQYQLLRKVERESVEKPDEAIAIPKEQLEDHPWPTEFSDEVGKTLRAIEGKLKRLSIYCRT